MALITIGGSEIAAVLNEGYGCTRALFYRKTGCESENPLTDDNPHIRRGNDMEPIIIRKFQEKYPQFIVVSADNAAEYGYEADERGVILQAQYEWKRAHVDALLLDRDPTRIVGILECKAPADKSFKTMKKEGLNIDYILQLQYYLSFCIGEVAGYYAIHGCGENWEYMDFPVEPDGVLEGMMDVACLKFINRVEDNDIPDQLDDDDKRCKRCEYRKLCRDIEIDYSEDMVNFEGNDEVIEAVMEYLKAAEIEAEAKVIKEENSTKIKDIMGEHLKGFFDGIKLTKYDSTKNNIDVDALRRDMPDIAKLYTKPGKKSTALKITRSKK